MANNNPYSYDPDIDADLFDTGETKGTGHTLGEVCPDCGEHHDLDGLPPELAALLARILPDGVGALVPSPADEVKMIHGFFNLLARLDECDPHGPVVYAQTVAAETGGRLRALIDLYTVERALIASHLALKSANDYLVGLRHEPEQSEDMRLHERLLSLGCDFILMRLGALGQRYAKAAAGAERFVDDGLLSTGVYSHADPLRERVLVAPLRQVMS